MKLKAYSIYDSAASAFNQPFFLHNDGMAIRSFQDNVNHEESHLNKHPDQFTLYHVGEFDDQEGTMTPLTPKSLGNGLQYKNPSEEDEINKKLDLIIKSLGDTH